MHVRPLQSVRRFLRADDGASAVEFALVVIPFLALVLAILQMALIAFLSSALQTATVASARYLATGQGVGISQSTFKTAVCNRLPSLFDCTKLMVDVQSVAPPAAGRGSGSGFSSVSTAPIVITRDQNGNVTNAFNFSPGAASGIMIIRVMYQWPFAIDMMNLGGASPPGGGFLMVGTSVLKNEPYS